nr:26S proteasome non-ATPase regulatory subunit 12 homolog A-like [Tanacetum cinerariifolium]GEW82145.1 26S proteasome non-ATPase regulatory subunit 12 homolog A-like [Tanacetum cinerariifolium]
MSSALAFKYSSHSRVRFIFVEIERARLIKRLAKIKEGQGKIAEAADLMQEISARTPLDVCGMAPSCGKCMADTQFDADVFQHSLSLMHEMHASRFIEGTREDFKI